MTQTVREFIKLAYLEIRVGQAGDVLASPQLTVGLQVLNEIIDLWNAKTRALYEEVFTSFTLTPSLQPHTVGPASGTPSVTLDPRPFRILWANLIYPTSPQAIRSKVNVRTYQRWRSVSAQAITSSVPTDLYYRPTWPQGQLYLWPIPTAAYQLELQTDMQFDNVDDSDDIDLPQGYAAALRLTLAERLAPLSGQTASQETKDAARDARATVFGNNDVPLDLNTIDGGAPGGTRRGLFNFLTGEVGR